MMKLKVLFANIYQGVIHEGRSKNGTHLFSAWAPSKYVEHFKQLDADICCFAEMVMDDEHGTSSTVEKMAKEYNMPFYRSLASEKSWMIEGKYYGLSILSKHPIDSYDDIILPNPNLTITKGNGDVWVSHDKTIQKAVINVEGQKVNLFNYHGVPYHHFKRKITEDEFAPIRLATSQVLHPDNTPTIITGDFNNENVSIEDTLPELFANGEIKSALKFDPLDYGDDLSNKTQVDHVLVSQDFKVSQTQVDKNYSDHCALVVTLEL